MYGTYLRRKYLGLVSTSRTYGQNLLPKKNKYLNNIFEVVCIWSPCRFVVIADFWQEKYSRSYGIWRSNMLSYLLVVYGLSGKWEGVVTFCSTVERSRVVIWHQRNGHNIILLLNLILCNFFKKVRMRLYVRKLLTLEWRAKYGGVINIISCGVMDIVSSRQVQCAEQL